MEWIKAQGPIEPGDKVRHHIKFLGLAEVIVFVNGTWCWDDENELVELRPDQWADIEYLDESPAPADGWARVEDGLPDAALGRYIVELQNGVVFEMEYSNISKRWWKIGVGDEHPDNRVIRWCLLPKPPKPVTT